ncbi:hypothetical protein C1645_819219 [Glomus cerebriforme]|uniref:Replication origin-binding protein domain-containing protein n=1 Tax=Glomus cerebriforme TaxID=658196 RepID=A0A397TBE0_9GLOM|nr:hypothetical protein C1645_819219 [Glomus cerebriforme]
MHISTISDQTDRTRTAPAFRYDGTSPNEYLSDSSSYTDNRSDLGSDNYNYYESNYESDNEKAPYASTNITKTLSIQLPNIEEQKVNTSYTLRQEKFNDKFSPKDLINKIQKIASSQPRDMSNDKGSLDCLPIYSFLFSNEKGSSLYNAYDRDEVKNKLVIKIDQDDDQNLKFSIADDIFEVYGLSEIHECINGQKPLRAVIDIDALQEDMKANGIKAKNWEDILRGLIITTSSDPSKCNYHILYALALLIDYQELKAFTELVYTLTEENSANNEWNELDYARVQLPTSLGLKVRPQMLSIEKNNNSLRISVGQDILHKCVNLVLQKHSNYLRDWNIKENDSQNFVYFNRKAPLECPLCKRSDEPGEGTKSPSFSKAFVKFPFWVKYNDPLTATETYEERFVRPLPNEGDIYVRSPWETRKTYILENLLDLKSYCDIDGNINLPDHKRVVCQIESLHHIVNKCKCNKKCKCHSSQYDLWLDEIVSIIAQAQSHLAGQSIEKLYKLVQDARHIIVIDNDLIDLNIEWIKVLRKDKLFSIIHNTFHPQKDIQGIIRVLKTDFSELQIKEYHGKSDPEEKAHDFSNVEKL